MSVMVIGTMSWQEKVGRCLFLLCCLTWASVTAQAEEKTEAEKWTAETPDTDLKLAYLSARSVAAATFAFYVADPLSCIQQFTLMIKQVASWCVTVGSGVVCDE
jgi:hypothetical protein